MAVGWFICPYKRADDGPGKPARYCAMDDFTAAISADGGKWRESEVLGDVAVVKVVASDTTLATIAGATGFVRVLAKTRLSDSLADLTATQRTAILNKLTSMGYTASEISTAMGGTLAGWRTKTFGDLLRFAATRRRKPRYDAANDAIVLDGAVQTPLPISVVDALAQQSVAMTLRESASGVRSFVARVFGRV